MDRFVDRGEKRSMTGSDPLSFDIHIRYSIARLFVDGSK